MKTTRKKLKSDVEKVADMEEEPPNYNIMVTFGLQVSVDEKGSASEENEQGVLPGQSNNKTGIC